MLKKRIIQALSERPRTIQELALLCNSPESSIRARISELRRDAFQIKTEQRPSFYYVLDPKTTNAQKIIEWFQEKNLFGISIDIEEISTELDIPREETERAISNLFDQGHRVTQIAKDRIIIRK
jgi:predicted transcriptional regulator